MQLVGPALGVQGRLAQLGRATDLHSYLAELKDFHLAVHQLECYLDYIDSMYDFYYRNAMDLIDLRRS